MKRFAAVALALLAACSGSPNTRPKTKASVTTTTASTSTSTSTTTASTTTSTTSAELARACRADDLGIESIQTNGAGGHEGLFVQLWNLSATPCSLADYPTALNATTPGGQPLTSFDSGTFFPEPVSGNLSAGGGEGLVIIETSNACLDENGTPPDRRYKDITIGLPGGGKLMLGDITINGACGVRISKLGVNPQQ